MGFLAGPKDDIKDAKRLALLTRNRKLLREVHHSLSENYEIRRMIKGYVDIIEKSVKAQNQMESIKENRGEREEFLIKKKEEEIKFYEGLRKEYEKRFKEIRGRNKEIKKLEEVEGIGLKGAVKIVGIVLEAERFRSYRRYLAYCGLVKYRKQSGGRDYGERITRYNRILKSVYKTAALSAINGEGVMREYYEFLVKEKGIYRYNARNTIARMIAKITLNIMKSGRRFNKERIREKIERERELLA